MDKDVVQQRQIVRVERLSSGVQIMANQPYLDARCEGVLGKVVSMTQQGTNMVIWVKHGATVAPYLNYELTLVGTPCD